MAMKKRTVFVIGAGASKPYGLPLGPELVQLVAESLDDPPPPPNGSMASMDHALQSRYQGGLRKLADRLRASRTPTIDEFILACESNEDRRHILTGMIDVIWRMEDAAAMSRDRPNRDWLGWLYHKHFHRSPDEFPRNTSIFVTFNYDRLPRIQLASMMASFHNRSGALCWNAVHANVDDVHKRFWHVYGDIAFPVHPDQVEPLIHGQYRKQLVHQAIDGISLVGQGDESHPGVDPRVAKFVQQQRCDDLWRWADRVILLGFGYHRENLNLIGLTKNKVRDLTSSGVYVGGTGFSLGKTERLHVQSLMGDAFDLGDVDQDCLAFLQARVDLS